MGKVKLRGVDFGLIERDRALGLRDQITLIVRLLLGNRVTLDEVLIAAEIGLGLFEQGLQRIDLGERARLGRRRGLGVPRGCGRRRGLDRLGLDRLRRVGGLRRRCGLGLERVRRRGRRSDRGRWGDRLCIPGFVSGGLVAAGAPES